MTIKNHDRYYDPPDEPEIPLCESCGGELEDAQYPITSLRDMATQHIPVTVCPNPYCPNKFVGEAKELAEKIVELTEELDEYKLRVRVLKNRLGMG